MLQFLLEITTSIMVLGIALIASELVDSKHKLLKNISYTCGATGLLLLCTGLYFGTAQSLHVYHYVSFAIEVLILGFLVIMQRQLKKSGHSIFIDICSICLVIISQLTYVYYIVASFIYY